MKKNIIVSITSILLALLFNVISVFGETIPSDNLIATPSNATPSNVAAKDNKQNVEKILNSEYEYETLGGRAILTKYVSESENTDIVVPDTIDGYRVERLEGTFRNNRNIESVIIPEGVKHLDEYTFYNCSNLKNVELPNSLLSINRGCFVDCDSLVELVIPENVGTIYSDGWVVIRGKSLYKITNLSKFKMRPFGDIPEDGYAWYLSESGGEPIDYIPEKSTVYRLKAEDVAKTETQKFVELYKNNIYNTSIYADKVNTKEQLLNFLNELKPENQNIKCNIEISYFRPSQYWIRPSGPNGRSVIKLKCSDNTNPSDTFETDLIIEIKYKSDELEEKYINIYTDMIEALKKTGVSMSIVNTEEQAKKYIEDLVSKNTDDRLDVSVWTDGYGKDNFKAAQTGTIENKNGNNGYFYVRIDIKNRTLLNDLGGMSTGTEWKDSMRIPIKAVKYTLSSSGSLSSSDRSSSSDSDDEYYDKNYLHITGSNITSGTWVKYRDKWRLRTTFGSYVRSRWANLDNKWYLIGPDTYMRTGWQMVDNKWYLLGPDGAMITGWYTDNGKRYWLESSGEMATGWIWIDSKWYYMDSTGAMMINTNTPDGYRVNKNGEWIQ